MFFPEVNRKSALFLFLYVGDTGDVEQQLTKTVLGNETSEPVTGQKHRGKWTDSRSDKTYSPFFPQRHQLSIKRGPKDIVPGEREYEFICTTAKLIRFLGISLVNITLLCV